MKCWRSVDLSLCIYIYGCGAGAFIPVSCLEARPAECVLSHVRRKLQVAHLFNICSVTSHIAVAASNKMTTV